MRSRAKRVKSLGWMWRQWRSWRLSVVLGLLSLVCTWAIAACDLRPNTIVIGSKDFTEQIVLGELLAQQIESQTDLSVDRRFNLGGTFVCQQALESGEIDVYPEYTGTAYTAVLKRKPISDPQAVFQQVKQAYAQQFGIDWLEPLGFENTYAMIIRGEDARRLNLQTISQAAKYTPQWQLGVGYEFEEREDGLPGLAKTYKLQFAGPPKAMDLGLIYRALTEQQVGMVAGNSTDGLIDSLKLAVLQDDKNYFPPYEAAPVVNQQTLKKHPELRQALQQLKGRISVEDMRRLNYQVDGERRDVTQVVQEFLQSKDF